MTSQAGTRSHAASPVRSHPKLRDVWPGEPGGAYDRGFRAPVGGEDILREVFYYAPVAGAKSNVALSTEYQGQKFTRDMLLEDAKFASRFASWLREHSGQSIRAIGELTLNLD